MSTIQASDILTQQLNGLLTVIKTANFSGSLEGLFAYHILEAETSFPLDWAVNNAQPAWLEEHKHELEHFPIIASIGYSLYHWQRTAIKIVREAFQFGVRKLEQRELFPDDGYSFINIPATLLGVVLGSLVAFSGEEQQDVLNWLHQILCLRRQRGIADFYQRLIYTYTSTLLDNAPATLIVSEKCTQIEALALLEWGWRGGKFRITGAYQDITEIRDELLKIVLTSSLSYTEAGKAAIIWSAIHSCLISQFQTVVQTPPETLLNPISGLEQVKKEIIALSPEIQIDFATLEARLLSLLDEENRFGPNEVIRSERYRVLEVLNKFCFEHLGKTFNEYAIIS